MSSVYSGLRIINYYHLLLLVLQVKYRCFFVVSDKTYPHLTYDVTTGKSRQFRFSNSGHFLQKFHSNYTANALMEMLNNL